MPTLNRRQARVAIANLEPFKGSNIYGYVPFYDGQHGTGILSNHDDLVRYHADRDRIQYIVYSYNTPIAWYIDGNGWYNVAQKFSVTTSCHAGLVPASGTKVNEYA